MAALPDAAMVAIGGFVLRLPHVSRRIVKEGDDVLVEHRPGGRLSTPTSNRRLPNGMNGLAVASALHDRLRRFVAAIILTGDISTETLAAVREAGCTLLNKPVQLAEVSRAIQRGLAAKLPAQTRASSGRLLHTPACWRNEEY